MGLEAAAATTLLDFGASAAASDAIAGTAMASLAAGGTGALTAETMAAVGASAAAADIVGGAAAGVGAGITLSNAAQAAGILGGVASSYASLTAAKATRTPPTPAPPPAAPPTLQSPSVTQAISDARRKASAAGGIMANIATSPQGVMGDASITGKSLLGQ